MEIREVQVMASSKSKVNMTEANNSSQEELEQIASRFKSKMSSPKKNLQPYTESFTSKLQKINKTKPG